MTPTPQEGSGQRPLNQPTQWSYDGNPPSSRRGVSGTANEHDPERTAADIKELRAHLSGFNVDELRQIPVLPLGGKLEAGATYINLRDTRYEFVADVNTAAGPDDWIVAKNRVDYRIWNKLRERTNTD